MLGVPTTLQTATAKPSTSQAAYQMSAPAPSVQTHLENGTPVGSPSLGASGLTPTAQGQVFDANRQQQQAHPGYDWLQDPQYQALTSYFNTINSGQQNYFSDMLDPGGYYSQIANINTGKVANSQGQLYDQFNDSMGRNAINLQGIDDQFATTNRSSQYLADLYNNAHADYQNNYGRVSDQITAMGAKHDAAGAYYDSMGQFANNDLQSQVDSIHANRGFADSALSQALGYLDQQQGYAGDSRDLGLATAGFNKDNSNRSNLSAAVASGAIGAGGTRDAFGSIAQQFGLDTTGVNNQYNQTLGGINNSRATTQNDYSKTLQSLADQWNGAYSTFGKTTAGLDQSRADENADFNAAYSGAGRDYASLDNQQQKADLTYDENQAQIGDQQKDLQRQADLYGMDAQSYESALTRGLKALGLDSRYNAASLSKDMASTKAQQSQLAQQIANEALQIMSQQSSSRGY